MKILATFIVIGILVSEILAFFVFHYEKSFAWHVSNVILVILNFVGFYICIKADPNDDKWKTYMPILALIALIIEVVLPQASTFNT